jgi:hypothetical protein
MAGACPFCGVATDAPHETQQGCIEALNAEIARMREILESVKSPEAGAPAAANDRRR